MFSVLLAAFKPFLHRPVVHHRFEFPHTTVTEPCVPPTKLANNLISNFWSLINIVRFQSRDLQGACLAV
jgi:hypothetical protein